MAVRRQPGRHDAGTRRTVPPALSREEHCQRHRSERGALSGGGAQGSQRSNEEHGHAGLQRGPPGHGVLAGCSRSHVHAGFRISRRQSGEFVRDQESGRAARGVDRPGRAGATAEAGRDSEQDRGEHPARYRRSPGGRVDVRHRWTIAARSELEAGGGGLQPGPLAVGFREADRRAESNGGSDGEAATDQNG